jgi:hypothetical protein
VRFWLIDVPALVLVGIWRLYLFVLAVFATVMVVTVLIMLGAFILGLPVPFVGSAP